MGYIILCIENMINNGESQEEIVEYMEGNYTGKNKNKSIEKIEIMETKLFLRGVLGECIYKNEMSEEDYVMDNYVTMIEKNYKNASELELKNNSNNYIATERLGCHYDGQYDEWSSKLIPKNTRAGLYILCMVYQKRNGFDEFAMYVNTQNVLLEFMKLHDDFEKLREEKELSENALIKENESLRTEIMYMPGGDGYYKAKEDFDELAKSVAK